jgi:hypothetical protein
VTVPGPHQHPAAVLIAAGGVYVPAELAEPVWRALRAELVERCRADGGGQLRPELAHLLEVLRAATLAHHLTATSAHGHDAGPVADMPAGSEPVVLLSTAELASRLDVSARHARRLTRQAGVRPAARDAWHPDTVTVVRRARGA